MFGRWARDWLLIDTLGLGIGAISTVFYVLYANSLPAKYDAYRDIWSNLGTEILGVWIAVRVIDALIKARAERNEVRNTVLANFNYMMEICQKMPPNFDEWRLTDLENELNWFNEKRQNRQGSKQLQRFFSHDERAYISAIVEDIAGVRSIALRFPSLKAQLQRLNDETIGLDLPHEVQRLSKLARSLLYGYGYDSQNARDSLHVVQNEFGQGQYKEALTGYVSELMEGVGPALAVMDEVHQAIDKVERSVGDFRRRIAEG